MTLTRRSLLATVLVLATAGCRPRRPAQARSAGPSVADRRSLDAAADIERQLIAHYDVAIAQLDAVAATPLTRARTRHQAHLAALTDAMSSTRPSSPATRSPATTGTAGLAPALTASVGQLQAAALRATSGSIAALLACVGAEHAADAATTAGASS